MPAEPTASHFRDRRALLAAGVSSLAGLAGCGRFFANGASGESANDQKGFDARRSKKYLDAVCRLGPRPSGSKGMLAQQKMIIKHFEDLGAKIGKQKFTRPHPVTGERVDMVNLIVTWQPESKTRVLLGCHYDTRPYPDQDPRNPRGTFLGANDGASGVALFMEFGHQMKRLKPTYGVDFVFFDAEEFIFEKDPPNLKGYFLGSKHFATEYAKGAMKHKYVYGIIADMVADRDLNIYIEKNSLKHAPDLTMSIWDVAKKLRIHEFIRSAEREVDDDHIPLNEIAKIPTCDIIDIDYPHWHTTRDTPAQCSGASLGKVGRVLMRWLENVPKPKR